MVLHSRRHHSSALNLYHFIADHQFFGPLRHLFLGTKLHGFVSAYSSRHFQLSGCQAFCSIELNCFKDACLISSRHLRSISVSSIAPLPSLFFLSGLLLGSSSQLYNNDGIVITSFPHASLFLTYALP